MLDFMWPSKRNPKRGVTEFYPKFIIGPRESTDLMTRGGDFYAVWNEAENLWSTDERVALYLIDNEVNSFFEKEKDKEGDNHVMLLHMYDTENRLVKKWHDFVKNDMRQSYHELDEKLIFSNTVTTKKDYASKRLSYPLEACPIPAYDELISTLYSPEERHKIEWAIGAIVCGDSKKIQKFLVMYGPAGTGKSTVLNIIQQLFEGYYCVFDSKALGSANSSFALEPFKSNPLVAIQHDGDLSHIEDNTRLNSLVSHEEMIMNEKFKSSYPMRFNCFLFMGTNRPVRITDAKSGIIRRLIDVSPTGNKIPSQRYKTLMAQVKFELGGIATHCLEVYKENPAKYDNYIPTAMMGASNDFYNFVLESYDIFKKDDSTTLKVAWEMYKNYCEEARVPYPLSLRTFKEELKAYFRDYVERANLTEENRVRNYYSGFIFERFESVVLEEKPREEIQPKLDLRFEVSLLDDICKDYPAQLATEDGLPRMKWANCTTKLKDISTKELHYLRVPENHIVIDFDIRDESGEKSFEKNAEAASKWPATYAELSKSGKGIHLHYIYSGDPKKLSRVYDDQIEIKVFTGNSSLRRKLTKCNDLAIATISTGLPLKEDKKMLDFEGLKNEKAIRTVIKKNLLKEYMPGTKPSIDFIFDTLEDAYKRGLKYDVTDMRGPITSFAANSTHQAEYCLKRVTQMKFKSKEESIVDIKDYESDTPVMFDVEVYPNHFGLVYKAIGKKPVIIRSPTAQDLVELGKMKLYGFNCRNYDNHMCGARILGEKDAQIYDRSKRIINDGDRDAFIRNFYNYSYADLYECATKKQGLKKWEIELGKSHVEMDIPWDKPVTEEEWDKVMKYCVNDVEATEAVYLAIQPDLVAHESLAVISGGIMNDTTNTLTTKLMFGNNRSPQSVFCYRDLSKPVHDIPSEQLEFLKKYFPEMMSERHGKENSLLPYFPGYRYGPSSELATLIEDPSIRKDYISDDGTPKGNSMISVYRGELVGEGGFVWAKKGMYKNVKVFDVASMHPHSMLTEYLFGPHTKTLMELVQARINIKHKEYDKAKQLFNGKLTDFLNDPSQAKGLSSALKLAINSMYGLTMQAEKGDYCSPFRDRRNKDNIVAKRGALFMIDLLKGVQELGGEVIHIKTDSIKVVDPSPEVENYILQMGKRHGYSFEVEHIFEKICLVNNAVYIAKTSLDDPEDPGHWTATGTQFAIPYVFKTLFSKEPLEFKDFRETKSVKTAMYLDMNEGMADGEHARHFVGKVGAFCPIKAGCGGGELVREGNNGKFAAVTGTKGYRWMEAEMVKTLDKEDDIDKQYYISLANQAIEDISKFGDFDWFTE